MIFKHQDMVIQTDHIIALRTEHPLANGKHVVALYTAYGKPLQLTMTAAERDELVAAMEPRKLVIQHGMARSPAPEFVNLGADAPGPVPAGFLDFDPNDYDASGKG